MQALFAVLKSLLELRRLYPWALLGALQLMIPGISFIGHLSGILVGWLYTKGWTQSAAIAHRTAPQACSTG